MSLNKKQNQVIICYLVFVLTVCLLLVPMEKINMERDYEGLVFRPIFIDEVREYTSETSWYHYGTQVDIGRLLSILISLTISALYLLYYFHKEDIKN